jgi:2-oxoglutarate ferredoxin oxidoreductase subunit delta
MVHLRPCKDLILKLLKFIIYSLIGQDFKFGGSMLATGFIEIDSELCKDCKLCISVCPHQLIESSDRMNQKGYYPACFIEKHLKKEGTKCTGCSLCAIFCPEIAIEVYRV